MLQAFIQCHYIYYGLKSDPSVTGSTHEITCKPSSVAAVLSVELQCNSKSNIPKIRKNNNKVKLKKDK